MQASDLLVAREVANMRGVVLAVAVAIAVLGIVPCRSAAGQGEETVLAASSPEEGTIKVGAEPRHIRLSDGALENATKWISSGRGRVYLVLDDVQARQPPAILYQVLLGTTAGGLPPSEVVGHLNFFEPSRKLLSFDVTAHLERLAADGPRDRALVATIRPSLGNLSLSPEARRDLEEAGVTIGRVRLVAQ
jgi:hypothetical protein